MPSEPKISMERSPVKLAANSAYLAMTLSRQPLIHATSRRSSVVATSAFRLAYIPPKSGGHIGPGERASFLLLAACTMWIREVAEAANLPDIAVDRPLYDVGDASLPHLIQVLRRLATKSDATKRAVTRCYIRAAFLHALEQPNDPAPRTPDVDAARMQACLSFVDQRLDRRLSIDDIASAAGLSTGRLSRLFRRALGCSPYQYVVQRRLEAARSRLLNSDDALADIAYDTGFSSQAHMTTAFRKLLGVTPGGLRAGVGPTTPAT